MATILDGLTTGADKKKMDTIRGANQQQHTTTTTKNLQTMKKQKPLFNGLPQNRRYQMDFTLTSHNRFSKSMTKPLILIRLCGGRAIRGASGPVPAAERETHQLRKAHY